MSNAYATLLLRTRIVYSELAFAELVLWRLPKPVPPAGHSFKYRLAYVVNGECVIRYDNESGKGDHVHFAGREWQYRFVSPERLVSDFRAQIERWNRENRDA